MAKSSKHAHYDAVKQAVVILMGSLARHLDKDDERIKPIVLRLIQALSTPSQTVGNIYFTEVILMYYLITSIEKISLYIYIYRCKKQSPIAYHL